MICARTRSMSSLVDDARRRRRGRDPVGRQGSLFAAGVGLSAAAEMAIS